MMPTSKKRKTATRRKGPAPLHAWGGSNQRSTTRRSVPKQTREEWDRPGSAAELWFVNCRAHSPEEWRRLFEAEGFTISGQPAKRPERGAWLYRGATYEARRGWAWAKVPHTAQQFARIRKGQMWRLWVPPHAMLAVVGPYVQEVVVDTDLCAEPEPWHG